MRLLVFFCALPFFAAPLWAEPREVELGDPLRVVLLDAIRPEAEDILGAPVLFRVIEIAAEGDRAFARLYGERPGGVPIDLATTPAVIDMGWSLDMFDGPRFEVFYHFTDNEWAVARWEVGATDAWWFGYDCANYAQFYPEEAC